MQVLLLETASGEISPMGRKILPNTSSKRFCGLKENTQHQSQSMAILIEDYFILTYQLCELLFSQGYFGITQLMEV